MLPFKLYMQESQENLPEQKSKLNKFQSAVRKLGWPFLTSSKDRHEKDFLKAYLKKFDADEVEVLRKVYKELSARNPGPGIDKATFLQYFPLPGLWGERLFQRFDYKGFGFVDYEELLVGLAICCRGTRCEIIQVLFQVFDLNNDGSLQKEELIIMLSNLPNLERYINTDKKKIPTRISDNSPRSIPLYPTLEGFSESKEVNYDINVALERLSNFPDDILGDEQFTVSINPDRDDDFEAENDSIYDSNDYSNDSTCSFALTVNEKCICRENTFDRSNEEKLSQADSNGCKSCDTHLNFFHTCNNIIDPNHTHSSCTSVNLNVSSIQKDVVNSDSCAIDNTSTTTIDRSLNPGNSSANINLFLGAPHNNNSTFQNALTSTNAYNLGSMMTTDSVHTNEEATNIDVEALVDKILEECEYCENDSLTFMEFKTWIEKNVGILEMFNQCLHEEAWGLQGNALYRKRKNKFFRISQNIANKNKNIAEDSKNFCNFSSENSKSLNGNSNLEIMPDTFYKIKKLFTVPANYRENIISSLNNTHSNQNNNSSHTSHNGERFLPELNVYYLGKYSLASGINSCVETPVNNVYDLIHEDTCENSKSASKSSSKTSSVIATEGGGEKQLYRLGTRELENSNEINIYTKQTREDLTLQLLDIITTSNPGVDLKTLMSQLPTNSADINNFICCPACECLLAFCPKCNKKFPELTLIDNRVIVECKECQDNNSTQFTHCWHCSWDFSLVVNYIDKCDPIYEGTLFKIGKHTRRWRKRYFVLVDNLLYYYNHKDDTKPQGFIFLEGCFVKPIFNNKNQSETAPPTSTTNGSYVPKATPNNTGHTPNIIKTLAGGNTCSRYGFSIIHGTNKRDFYVSTELERNLWIEALCSAMKQYDIQDLYLLQQLIGQGKFSVVHKAVRKKTQQVVAIKIIDRSKISEHEKELLRSEIAILRLLHHPHVISLREVVDTQTEIYLIMELVAGGELYDLLQQKKRLPESQVNRIIFQLLSTVAYLHKCGIIHRDLKPENILLTDGTINANIKVTDFGLSCICGLNEFVTQPCGTLAYVAPEVLTLQGYNHKADVWSVGVIMYLLLCGRLPFPITQPGSTTVTDRSLQFEGSIWDSVCSSAKDLLRKLLCSKPEKRISAQEALQHIWLKNPTAVMSGDDPENSRSETNERDLSSEVPPHIAPCLHGSSSTLSLITKCDRPPIPDK